MTVHWLEPLERALDQHTEPIDVFFRDDDAGWDDDALFRLIDVFITSAVPIDLAAIPEAMSPRLAARLRPLREAGVRVHQHGRSHTNHQSEGRKCEFGSHRTTDELHSDVLLGQRQLRELFGDDLDPVFTPPWNRCVPSITDALAEAGISVLSRDHTAAPLTLPPAGLREVPVNVDWFGQHKGVRWTLADRGQRMADRVDSHGYLGVMLHHAVTTKADRHAVSELVSLVATHPILRPIPLVDQGKV